MVSLRLSTNLVSFIHFILFYVHLHLLACSDTAFVLADVKRTNTIFLSFMTHHKRKHQKIELITKRHAIFSGRRCECLFSGHVVLPSSLIFRVMTVANTF